MSVCVGFSYPKRFKLSSWVISKWMGAPYSHVYLKFKSSAIQDTVYQAAYGSVHFMAASRFLDKNDVIYETDLHVDLKLKKTLLINSIDLASEPYGYLEIFKIVIADLFKINLKNSRGYICSELVGLFLSQYFKVSFNKPMHLLTPKDIKEALNGQVIV